MKYLPVLALLLFVSCKKYDYSCVTGKWADTVSHPGSYVWGEYVEAKKMTKKQADRYVKEHTNNETWSKCRLVE